PAGRLADVDEAACRLLDYSRDALLQLALVDLTPLPPGSEAARVVQAQLAQARAAPATFDTTARRRDGSLVPLRLRVQALEAPQGPVLRAVAYDLSAEQQAQGRTLAGQEARLLPELGAGLAHELNSPLAVVLGHTEMLLDES